MSTGLVRNEWRHSFWWMGFMSSAGIFVEKKQRRAELALYVSALGLAFSEID